MKIICQLPDRKHYKSITPTDAWYRWEDRGNSKVRLMCKSIDPWQYDEVAVMFLLAMSKSDNSQYPAALHLKIYPNPEKDIKKGKIVREYFKAAFPHSQADGLIFFAAFPVGTDTKIPHWLGYSFLCDPLLLGH